MLKDQDEISPKTRLTPPITSPVRWLWLAGSLRAIIAVNDPSVYPISAERAGDDQGLSGVKSRRALERNKERTTSEDNEGEEAARWRENPHSFTSASGTF